jgi:UDP-N-acetyl-D-mannosaminuronate dehydrogenase
MVIKKGMVIGLGEVGYSWFKVLGKKGKLDVIGIDNDKGNLEKRANVLWRVGRAIVQKERGSVLHACIPYFSGGKFEKIISAYVKEYHPDLVIVNTSCKMGSTRKLYDAVKVPMVHIPVRGVHPHIDKGIKTFENAIGPIDEDSAKLAEDYLDTLGIKHVTFNSPEESELAKLLDTTYYGSNILFSKVVDVLCEALGLDFSNVYTNFNKSYNEGYEKLGKPNVRRPVLIPPQRFNRTLNLRDNKMNGHCIRTNLEILKTMDLPDIVRKFVDSTIELDEHEV